MNRVAALSRLMVTTVTAGLLWAAPVAAVWAAETSDVSFMSYSTGTERAITNSQYFGQSFISGLSGALSRVAVPVRNQGSVTQPLSVSIYAANGSGLPSGTALASKSVPVADLPMFTLGVVEVSFDTAPNVVSGGRYVVVLSTTDTSFNLLWGESAVAYVGQTSSYSTNQGGSWSPYSATMAFQTWVSTPDEVSSVAEGPGPADLLQQLPRTMDCADFRSDTGYNWAGVGSGGWTPSWAQWMNGGLGGPVCSRTLYHQRDAWAIR